MMSASLQRLVGNLCLIFSLASGGDVTPVYGLVNQSITMSLPGDPSRPVQHVYWNVQSHIMATYLNNQLSVIRSQYDGRLEILDNGRALRIGPLRLEDSGVYAATITFTDKSIQDTSYNVTVYEPVPVPSIRFEVTNTSDWCNVTLRCSVQGNQPSLSYTWKYRHGDSDYKTYDNHGDTIQISLQHKDWDSGVMCEVHNPADSKYDSVTGFCPVYRGNDKDKSNRQYYIFWVPLLLVPIIIMIIALVPFRWYSMKWKQRKETSADNINGEPQYIQVTTVRPNDNQQDWNNTLYNPSPRQKSKAETLYAVLQHQPKTKT